MIGTASYLTGEGAGGDLPGAGQGWGLLNLNRAFDSASKVFVNQSTTFSDSGQEFVLTGEVKDSSQPFRVTLAWSDAPGFSGFAPWVNDLDLEVSINGQVYRGNNFVGQNSQPGGASDTKKSLQEYASASAGVSGRFRSGCSGIVRPLRFFAAASWSSIWLAIRPCASATNEPKSRPRTFAVTTTRRLSRRAFARARDRTPS